MRSNLYIFILAFCPLFIFSCANDDESDERPCIENTEIGDFFMLESSKDFLPYPNEEAILIFSDSIGNEYRGVFTIREITSLETMSTYQIDPSKSWSTRCDYSYLRESKISEIIFPELEDLTFRFEFNVGATISENDEILLSDRLAAYVLQSFPEVMSGISGFQSLELSLVLNQRNNDQILEDDRYTHHITYESFVIHDKPFENVYFWERDNVNENLKQFDYDAYYSEEIGLVAFENYDKSISLKFERIE